MIFLILSILILFSLFMSVIQLDNIFFLELFLLILLNFFIIRLLKPRLGNKNVNLIRFIILIHICLAFLYINFEWYPALSSASTTIGGDAQRYYYEAKQIKISDLYGTNYIGI